MISLQEMAQLSTLYTQPHRKYHNINHINACLVELQNMPTDLITKKEYTNIETAIWYHDAVYNPYSKTNEDESGKLYQPTGLVEDMYAVLHAIHATKYHLRTQQILRKTTQVMLDIDLSGFGKSLLEFATNGMNIRHEYYNTTLRDFLNGRLNFYNELCKRETLYYTDYFRDKYHKTSQENIKWEMSIIEHTLAENNLNRWRRAMEDVTIDY